MIRVTLIQGGQGSSGSAAIAEVDGEARHGYGWDIGKDSGALQRATEQAVRILHRMIRKTQ